MQSIPFSVHDFTYSLPAHRIAKYPLANRDDSKLLIYKHGNIAEDKYANLAHHLPENAMLVFNDTKVIEARILFQKASGGFIEIFCLEPGEQYRNLAIAMSQKNRVLWKCLIGGVSKWKKGQVLEKQISLDGKEHTLRAYYVSKNEDYFIIEFQWLLNEVSFAQILHLAGSIPLPPYIKRKASEIDIERYQTIYASFEGSVASPTAGLHFTENIFRKLASKNIKNEFITLHVAAGTFKPMTSNLINEHKMHEERIELPASSILSLAKHFPMPIIPVGTTSLRTIESLFWLGVKTFLEPDINEEALILKQWEDLKLYSSAITAIQAFNAILEWMDKRKLDTLNTRTGLLITPGYQFKIAKALITNFHQPHSTLLVLVAAFIGEDWKKVYEYALQNQFRFLSYGDGCLLFPGQEEDLFF
jgi:S-adenosylmethionine:tRNA ribosyltransferase-isomerase